MDNFEDAFLIKTVDCTFEGTFVGPICTSPKEVAEKVQFLTEIAQDLYLEKGEKVVTFDDMVEEFADYPDLIKILEFIQSRLRNSYRKETFFDSEFSIQVGPIEHFTVKELEIHPEDRFKITGRGDVLTVRNNEWIDLLKIGDTVRVDGKYYKVLGLEKHRPSMFNNYRAKDVGILVNLQAPLKKPY